LPAGSRYDPGLVVLSVVIAVAVSFTALLLARFFRRTAPASGAPKVFAAILMGAAVYGMHYTGMLAVDFHPAESATVRDSAVIASEGLAWAIAVAATFIIGVTVFAGVAERRLAAAHKVAQEATRDRTRVVETLHQIGQSLASELDVQRIVQTVTDAATELTGAQFGAFFYNLIDEAGEAYTLYTISGVPREAFERFPMPRNTPVFAPTFYGEGVVRSDDITRDPRYGRMAPHHGMPAGHLPVRSYLAVPVISRNGAVLGGLFFGHEAVGVFNATHEHLAVGIAGWAAVAMDNARLFEAEQRARVDAERANRAKSDFLAVMSHELRTPLNAILGYTDLILAGVDGAVSPDMKSKMDRVGLSARHLLGLIEEILTFARLEAGEERIDLERVEIGEVLGEIQALMEPQALNKGIRFNCRTPQSAETIETDRKKLRQILLNLVSNAVKFTSAGTVEVTAELIGDDVRFTVLDTGRGIAREHQEKIFDAFWQIENASTRVAGGTGLGLSVSRRLARLLGGDISVTSEVGRGSAFAVMLPRRPRGVAERPVAIGSTAH